jgi:hypothetical protein
LIGLVTSFIALRAMEEIEPFKWVVSVARVSVLADVDHDNGGGNVIVYRLKSFVQLMNQVVTAVSRALADGRRI